MMAAAPWLEGLGDEDWIPQPLEENVPDAETLNNSVHSLNRSYKQSTKHSSSTLQHAAMPLAEIDTNTSRRHNDLTVTAGTPVFGTVQQSTTKVKPKYYESECIEDLPEWRRRILRGENPMGSRGDLFGPIGLETIFNPPEQHISPIKTTIVESNIPAAPPPPQRSSPYQEISRPQKQDGDSRLNSKSGIEELRNEEITPIVLSSDGNQNLAGVGKPKISVSHPDIEGDDPFSKVGDTIDVTSQSLPEDLSMGTQDVSSTAPLRNSRREYSNDGFPQRILSLSSHASQLYSSHYGDSLPQSPEPAEKPGISNGVAYSPEIQATPFRHDALDTTTTPKSSPLKLFGNYDTFTNDRLLRRMSQFDGTLGDASKEPSSSAADNNVKATEGPGDHHAEVPGKKSMTPNTPRRRSAIPVKSPSDKIKIPVDTSILPPASGNMTKGAFSNLSHDEISNGSPNFKNRPKKGRIPVPVGKKMADGKRAFHNPLKGSRPKRQRTLSKLDLQIPADAPILDSAPFPRNRDSSRTSRPKTQALYEANDKLDTSSGLDDKPEAGLPFFNEGRKGSITTQDFLNEATKIMEAIRASKRPQSVLENVDEHSDSEQSDNSTIERLSRPPSREGQDLRILRAPREENPRVVSHLRKFKESDDMDQTGLNASFISLNINKDDIKESGGQDTENHCDVEESDLQNIVIRPPVTQHETSKSNSASARDFCQNSVNLAQNSHNSMDDHPSLPTDQSRGSSGSGTKGVISSEVASHIIPNSLGKMVYDHKNCIWVKGDAIEKSPAPQLDSTEDDPFKEIPDLSVDELQELFITRSIPNSPSKAVSALQQDDRQSTGTVLHNIDSSRPQTRDGKQIPCDSSSVQSKSTRFTSSCPRPETRATSWGTDEFAYPPRFSPGFSKTTADEHTHQFQPQCQLQSEITPTKSPGDKQARMCTITFSSPLVSQVAYQDNVTTSESSSLHEEQNSRFAHELSGYHPPTSTKSMLNSEDGFSRTRFIVRSFSARGFKGRPISRIEERSERSASDSPVSQGRELSIVRISNLEDGRDTEDINHDFQLAHLTTLPDFTLHQADDPIKMELSHVAQRTQLETMDEVQGTFALAVEDLVKHITDVEPFNLHWEDLRKLNLRDKGLITLHRLKDFCPRLVDLDVSDNEIGHLSGIPEQVRNLNLARNCLSDLTAWSHMFNLQYVDVSGNELESLDAFAELVHLRGLKANNNKIRNANGVFSLDGLLALNLAGNELTEFDFGTSKM